MELVWILKITTLSVLRNYVHWRKRLWGKHTCRWRGNKRGSPWKRRWHWITKWLLRIMSWLRFPPRACSLSPVNVHPHTITAPEPFFLGGEWFGLFFVVSDFTSLFLDWRSCCYAGRLQEHGKKTRTLSIWFGSAGSYLWRRMLVWGFLLMFEKY